MRKLPKTKGHVLNWYSNSTLRPLEPQFVSTVDSGNLAACLWTLKQAALAFASRPPAEEVLWAGIMDTAREALPKTELHLDGLDLAALEEIAAGLSEKAADGDGFWSRELLERIKQARSWQATGLPNSSGNSFGLSRQNATLSYGPWTSASSSIAARRSCLWAGTLKRRDSNHPATTCSPRNLVSPVSSQ